MDERTIKVEYDDRCGCEIVIDVMNWRFRRVLERNGLSLDEFFELDKREQWNIVRGHHLDDEEDAFTEHDQYCSNDQTQERINVMDTENDPRDTAYENIGEMVRQLIYDRDDGLEVLYKLNAGTVALHISRNEVSVIDLTSERVVIREAKS